MTGLRRGLLSILCRRLREIIRGIVCVSMLACSTPDRDVLLITVDTLRFDRVGLYGAPRGTTPEIDAFFAEGALFTRAYATSAGTPPSVVSLLTGLLPAEHGVRRYYQTISDGIEVIPEQLEGYASAAVVSNATLTDRALGIAGRFDFFDDELDREESTRPIRERSASAVSAAALRWLETQAPRDAPIFLWVHYVDPHAPYRPPPGTKRRFGHPGHMPIDSARVPAFMREEDVVDGLDYVDRYDEEVAYVDVEVGRLLRGFARRRSIEDSLVIFTADHGESLLERERLFSHGFEIFEEVVRVPLLFHGPGVVSGQYDVPVSGIDVHTTILRFAGGVSSKGGWDLRNPAEIPRDRRIFFESVTRPLRWHAVVEGQRKWALRVDAARQPERVERFHLGRDPGELQAEAVEVLEPALEALLDRIRRDPAPAGITAGGPAAAIESDHAPDLDARAREKLRALGYLD